MVLIPMDGLNLAKFPRNIVYVNRCEKHCENIDVIADQTSVQRPTV